MDGDDAGTPLEEFVLALIEASSGLGLEVPAGEADAPSD